MTSASSPPPSRVHRRQFLAGTAATGAVALAGCISTGTGISNGSRTERFDVSDDLALRVVADNGHVVVGSARPGVDRVEVRSTVASNGLGNPLDSAPVETAVENDRYVVHAGAERDGFLGGRVRHDVEVRVPAAVTVARVETANGHVEVSGVTGDVHATSENGNVSASTVDGVVRLESRNGDVEVVATRGVAFARTENGDVDVELVELGQDGEFRSENGNVVVHVDPTLDADVDLRSGNGDVDVRGIAIDRDVDERRHVEGRLGAGGYRILAQTGNGAVTLRAR